MRPLLLFLMLFSHVSSSFLSVLTGSSTPPPQQYRAYGAAAGGCSSSGCVPATIVPMSSGFWPNADVLTGLQREQQFQNQLQRDDVPAGTSGSAGISAGMSGIASSTSQPPVIFIARAGSDQYKYSPVVSSSPSPLGSEVGWNTGGLQNQGSSQFGGSQQSLFGASSGAQGSNYNSGGFSNPFGTSSGQNTFGGSSGNQGAANVQNPFSQVSPTNSGAFGASSGAANGQNALGGLAGAQNNQGSTNGQNTFGQGSSVSNSGNQNTFGQATSGNSNNQSPQLAQQGSFGGFGSQTAGQFQPGSQPSVLPFGLNMMPNNAGFGPAPSPRQVGTVRQAPPFSDMDWNFQPGSQGVHYVGGGSNGGGAASPPMSEEAQQIAVQIQAIRDNLSITQNESSYLISQLKASLPPDLQNQLQSV